MAEIKLYSYFRSSSAYRVRIALELKGLGYEYCAVHLVKDGGEQHLPDYRQINPARQLPTLDHDGQLISQSMAILGYLDDLWPTPALFPSQPFEKAQVTQLCELINSGIQPIQNLSVLQEIEKRYQADQTEKADWARHWISEGFVALEKKLEETAGAYSFGSQPTAADCYLVPQMYNARRFKVNLDPFPLISRVEENCLKLDAFQKAEPSAQPDAPSS